MSVKLIIIQSNKAQTHPKTSSSSGGNSSPTETHSPNHILLIDKLSVTIKPANKQDACDIQSTVFTSLEDKTVFQSAIKSGGAYQVVRSIACAGSEERVRFEYAYEDHAAKLFRLEFNPSKLGPNGLDGLHSALITLLPDGWGYVIQHGRVTRIDIAVDISGLRMGAFLFLPQQGLTTKTWAVDGQLQTIVFGTSKGNQTRIYSKKKEQLAKGKPFSGPSVVRVERTLRNPSSRLLRS